MIMLKQKDKTLFKIYKRLINRHMSVSRNNVRVSKILESSKENNSAGKNIKKKAFQSTMFRMNVRN